MNIIMNKSKNSLKLVNVNKLMFIYMNQQIFNRFQKIKHRFSFAEVHINENYLCEMKKMLLQKKNVLFDQNIISFKRSTSQKISENATRIWTKQRIIN